MKNLKNPYAQNFVARFTWCLTNRHRYMIFTLKNNFWWYFIIKKTYLAKKGHFTAILRQLTDQKMPQSAEKGAQKILHWIRFLMIFYYEKDISSPKRPFYSHFKAHDRSKIAPICSIKQIKIFFLYSHMT